MREIRRLLAVGLLFSAFWGLMYPRFSLLQETYVCLEGEKDVYRDFFALLEADRGEIVIKSKLLQLWEERRAESEEK